MQTNVETLEKIVAHAATIKARKWKPYPETEIKIGDTPVKIVFNGENILYVEAKTAPLFTHRGQPLVGTAHVTKTDAGWTFGRAYVYREGGALFQPRPTVPMIDAFSEWLHEGLNQKTHTDLYETYREAAKEAVDFHALNSAAGSVAYAASLRTDKSRTHVSFEDLRAVAADLDKQT